MSILRILSECIHSLIHSFTLTVGTAMVCIKCSAGCRVLNMIDKWLTLEAYTVVQGAGQHKILVKCAKCYDGARSSFANIFQDYLSWLFASRCLKLC